MSWYTLSEIWWWLLLMSVPMIVVAFIVAFVAYRLGRRSKQTTADVDD